MSFMDLKQKYQDSMLGFFWSFLKPFLQFVAYYVIFAKILNVGSGVNYALRLFFGVLLWAWFAESTSLGFNSYIEKRSVVTKIKVSRYLPPVAAYTTQTMNYFLNLILFFILYVMGMPSFPVGLLSFYNFFIFFMSFCSMSLVIVNLNIILANLNVLYRDIRPIWELVLSYGIFATPIIYHIPIPEKYQTLYYAINLIALPLEAMKSIFFVEQSKTYLLPHVLIAYIVSLAILILMSRLTYKKLSKKIIDYL
ncbi:MAG: polysaccharide ABC exporter membrane-spanning protein [uncultured bacterium]|nr:MAG: polysaccharide ABC exporter membrane-spanning protein [uncultured bacterium]